MKIICVGRNYVDHAKELNNPVPEKPLLFMKPPSALLRNPKPFYYPDFSEDVHYEAELVIRIGKNGKSIQPEFAHTYYDAIGLGIDFTARDLQRQCKEKGHPWEIAKGFDGSAYISELVILEPKPNQRYTFDLKQNGQLVQEGNTDDLIFSIEYLLSYISKFFKLTMGDLIYTGTPVGVGPIKVGDRLEGSLEGKACMDCWIK